MKPNFPPSLRRIVDRYVHAFAPERILLFGSYAKGTNKPGSDMDLLIVADLGGELSEYRQRARQLAADCFPRVDVVFATPEEVYEAVPERDAFLLSVCTGGILLYAKDKQAFD